MPSLKQFIERAQADRPVYISDLRDAFEAVGTRPFHFHMRLYDESVRRFSLKLPPSACAEEASFVREYLNATIYNALSALGARQIDIYIDPMDAALKDYASKLVDEFQVNLPLAERSGYGKCLNVNQRTLKALCGADSRFAFHIHDLSEEPDVPAVQPVSGTPVFDRLPEISRKGMLMGMDIGGTDVKLAASVDGRLCALKEYDWNPAGMARAEQLIGPLILLTRLMRAAACMVTCGRQAEVPVRAFERTATEAEMLDAIEAMEAQLGDRLKGFDGIALCFPDVVIRDRIVGGEAPKTQGMRENTALDYEAQFAKLTDLKDLLSAFVQPGDIVSCINDGPMAAFTTAVELASAGRPLADGCFAHTLGTDLGTGWVLPSGIIPEIPLEVYNLIIDLGSRGQRRYSAEDARSVRGFGTGLPGAAQRYVSQSGVFRLALSELPDADPALYADALQKGLFEAAGERLYVPIVPRDMRKPCLAYFMQAAEDPESAAAEIFRQVGEALAVIWRETQYLLAPACRSRTLYGRLVKTPACYERICEGARRVAPALEVEAADERLANTPLMRELAARPDASIAQFAQAIGAIHYACVGRLSRT